MAGPEEPIQARVVVGVVIVVVVIVVVVVVVGFDRNRQPGKQ